MTEKTSHEVRFDDALHAPMSIDHGENLSLHLTAANSPILFGCRSGICGTCVSKIIEVKDGALNPPSEDEMELLSIVAPDEPAARLACQISITASLTITPLK